MADQEGSARGVVHLPLDARAERGTAALRWVAAFLSLFGGLWLLALPYPLPRAIAVLGLVFSAIFLRQAARSRGQSLRAADHYLEITPDELRLRQGDKLEILPWSEVQSVAIDEDHLTVTVARKDGPPLELEPRYSGLGLRALGEAVHRGLASAKRRGGCAPATDG
jgi:hypothetical protein